MILRTAVPVCGAFAVTGALVLTQLKQPDLTSNSEYVAGGGTDAGSVPSESYVDGHSFEGGTEGTSIAQTNPLEKYRSNPNVIWGNDIEKKGGYSGEKIEAGSVKISDSLRELMKKHNENSAVFAVMVDFSPCVDTSKMESWDYNGDNILSLKNKLDAYFYDTGESYTYIDGTDNSEHTSNHRAFNPEDGDKINELCSRIETIKAAYFDMKFESFKDSFEKNGLEIYLTEDEDVAANPYFYTFASKSQIDNFKCGESEAFIFYPAAELKSGSDNREAFATSSYDSESSSYPGTSSVFRPVWESVNYNPAPENLNISPSRKLSDEYDFEKLSPEEAKKYYGINIFTLEDYFDGKNEYNELSIQKKDGKTVEDGNFVDFRFSDSSEYVLALFRKETKWVPEKEYETEDFVGMEITFFKDDHEIKAIFEVNGTQITLLYNGTDMKKLFNVIKVFSASELSENSDDPILTGGYTDGTN